MKRLLLIVAWALLSVSAFAQSSTPILVTDTNGDPKVQGVTEIRFPEGSVTKQGAKAIISFTAGGAVGGSGTANTLAKWTSASAVGNATGLTSTSSGQLTLGTASSLTGALKFAHASSANTGTISPPNWGGNRTLTLPDATDTLVGKATGDVFTNKTLSASSNVLGGVTMTLGSDADGDIYYRSSGVLTRLAKGTAGQVLVMNGGATAPAWASTITPNLTFSGTLTFSKATYSTATTLTDAATIATDASLASRFKVTLTAARTLGAPTNAVANQQVIWEICQDGTGGWALTLDTGAGGFVFGTDITSITNTTTASKCDYLTAIYDSGASKWRVVGFIKGF